MLRPARPRHQPYHEAGEDVRCAGPGPDRAGEIFANPICTSDKSDLLQRAALYYRATLLAMEQQERGVAVREPMVRLQCGAVQCNAVQCSAGQGSEGQCSAGQVSLINLPQEPARSLADVGSGRLARDGVPGSTGAPWPPSTPGTTAPRCSNSRAAESRGRTIACFVSYRVVCCV